MARLLVVEDDPSLLAGLRDLLSLSGHQVRAASSGEAAWEAVQAELPELVVTDVVMPGMSGLDLLQAVRGGPEGGHLPFIFISATILSNMEEQIKALPDATYLRKPFEVDTLIETINSVLGPASPEGVRCQVAPPGVSGANVLNE